MVGWQIAHYIEQKHDRKNKNHAFRSPRQQREAPALELNDTMLIEEDGTYPTEGKYKDLFDGMYKKTIYVKTWTGRTVSLETDLDREVETVKRQLEAKTGIPKDHQHLVSRGKVLKDNRTLKEYGISGGEAIELTGKLRGGMKHKSPSPTPMNTERDKKRKEFEPYIDTSGLENAKSQTESDEEMVRTKKWMTEAMRELKERTDDVSEVEQSMTKVQLDMETMKENLSKVGEAITRISEDNNTRDRRFQELIKGFSTGLQERDMKIDKKIEGLEKQMDTKIEEKFAGLETRISAIEKGTMGDGYKYSGSAQGKSGYVPTDCKAVLHGFNTESREENVKAIVMQTIKATGMKEEHVVDYPTIPITHVFVEFGDTRTRDRFVRSANMRNCELDGRRIKISPALEADERFDRKRLGYIKYETNKERDCTALDTNELPKEKHHD